MWKYLVILLLMACPARAGAQLTSDPGLAFERAAATGRPVLLVFEGSDWCIPCIRLERKVFSTDTFIRFAEENLVVLKVDFPQKKKIKAAWATRYEALALQYNAEGRFPKMILITVSGKAIDIPDRPYSSPAALIDALRQELKQHHEEM